MTTSVHQGSIALPRAMRQLTWFALGAALAFAVPFVGVSVLGLQHDLYYAAYFTITLLLLGTYARSEQVDLRALFTRNWLKSVAIGVPVAAFVVWNVLHSDGATSRPHGAYFAFELVWRGLGYGLVDALLLTAFPCVVAYSILHGRASGPAARARYIAIALPLIMLITATYHLGYPQYRQDGIGKPEIGNTIISVPMLATANPIGAIAAHASMHIAAVTHSYETRVFLPPKTTS
jgi:hypothetical protein